MSPPAKSKLLPVRFPGEATFCDPPSSVNEDEGRREFSHAQRLSGFLRDSLQMQHLAVLAGSGCSFDKGPPSMGALWNAVAALDEYKSLPEALREVPESEGIEALLSRCDAFLSVYDSSKNAAAQQVRAFRDRSVEIILTACRVFDKHSLSAHTSFLKKLARRRTRDSRLKLFTTNYDKAFEMAAERLGQVAIDGFSYSFPRTFNPRHFALDLVERGREHDATAFAPGIFQYFKLHGSVNWARRGDEIGERLIVHDEQATANDVVFIYPTRSKYQLSYAQPHLELMTHYLACLREPNTCLVVVGFGFNDSHLSEPILAALRGTPGFRLIVVTPGAKSSLESGNPVWRKLASMTTSREVDATFIAATFDDFVASIPDLAALPPAEHLAQHLRRVLSGEES